MQSSAYSRSSSFRGSSGFSRSSGYSRSSSSTFSRSRPVNTSSTTVIRSGGGYGMGGLATGMLVGAAISNSHHNHGGYYHNDSNYHSYVNHGMNTRGRVNLCQNNPDFYGWVFSNCKDTACIETYCLR